jgi:hypothetical protein
VKEKAEKINIQQRKKNKLSISAGKTNYPAAQEKQTIHQCTKNKLSSSARKTHYPPVQEKQAIHQCKKTNYFVQKGF